MAVTPEPGDVVLVARLREASWISRAIQRATGSWYSHALIHLGQDRYAHALPKRGGSITVMETDAELAGNIVDYVLYDLFRPASAPSPEDLLSAVEHYQARAAEWLVTHINPCGRVAESPGMIFSDGSLLVLSLIRWVDDLPPPVRRLRRMRLLRDALLVTANDKDGRLFCSEFVHRVLDAAGARPAAASAGRRRPGRPSSTSATCRPTSRRWRSSGSTISSTGCTSGSGPASTSTSAPFRPAERSCTPSSATTSCRRRYRRSRWGTS